MPRNRREQPFLPLLVLLLTLTVWPAYGQQPETIRVGTYECPPFIMQNRNGGYEGLSMMLWELTAQRLALE